LDISFVVYAKLIAPISVLSGSSGRVQVNAQRLTNWRIYGSPSSLQLEPCRGRETMLLWCRQWRGGRSAIDCRLCSLFDCSINLSFGYFRFVLYCQSCRAVNLDFWEGSSTNCLRIQTSKV